MNTSIFIAKRYLTAKRKQVFISFISLISIFGVALGVAALIITLSVMNGFHIDLRDKILGINPHVIAMTKSGATISNYDRLKPTLEKIEGVIATSPFVYGQGILKNKKISIGGVVKGITENEHQVTTLAKYIKRGESVLSDNKIMLGRELAKRLNITVGNELIFVSPEFSLNSFGKVPKWKKLIVSGIFESGMYEYDSNLAYIDINTASDIFNTKEGVTGIGIKVDNFYKADKIARKIEGVLGYEYFAKSWTETNYSLFTALKLEKIVMFIILVLIVIVAAFGITSSLMMMTMEKIKDIGILKAIGFRERKISEIFIYQGLFIGLVGTILGIVLGLGISILLDNYKFIKLPQDVYYLSTLPVKIKAIDILLVSIVSIIISLISAVYPAKKAAKLNPVTALRYE